MPKNSIRVRNKFDPKGSEPFKVSRSKIELFLRCPRCFYLDRRLGIGRIPPPAFTLNSATDTLLKKEFDVHRLNGTPHPLMVQFGIEAIPFRHPDLNLWRENYTGVQYFHAPTNFIVTGAIDDVWIDRKNILHVVDYKSTSTTKEISLEDEYKQGFKRQMEMYQWLLKRNTFDVSDTGYFVYVNADTGREGFDGKLIFRMQIISYAGKDDWVEDAILAAHECLMSETIPSASPECEWCGYVRNCASVS